MREGSGNKQTFDGGATAAHADAVGSIQATCVQELEGVDEEGAETVSERREISFVL